MSSTKNNLRRSLYVSSFFVLVMWLVFLLETVLGANWYAFGIYPRSFEHIGGILTSPFLHGDWGHLLANTPPVFSLLFLLFFFYPRMAPKALATLYILTGAAVWVFAREVFHIGASGVVYALATFLAWSGIVRRNIKAIAIALVVLFYYGGMFVGIVPGQPGISWESHLLGAIVGILIAQLFKNIVEPNEEKKPHSYELEEPQPEKPFLDPNTFDQTKRARQMNQFWKRLQERDHAPRQR